MLNYSSTIGVERTIERDMEDMKQYLLATEYIDCDHQSIVDKAQELTNHLSTDEEKAAVCFFFVRDEIFHSNDYSMNPITIVASDVLHYKTGYCYAKSHLLAALLRALQIPAGLCYQRLTVEDKGPPFCLHGLNAVYLEKHGWYRMDARGNKQGVNAQFSPPTEQLAFPIQSEGECDIQGIWPEPLPMVVDVLKRRATYEEVHDNLPDIDVFM